MSNQSSAPAETGTAFGSKYLLHEAIGSGAHGRIFRASERGSGASLAVKLLREDLATDPTAVARLVSERELLRGVHHPNVNRIHDLVVDDGQLGIVMDLVTGGELRHTYRPPTSVAVTCTIFTQLARGVAALHERNITHRDLKPENVLVAVQPNDTLRLVVTDFGLSHIITSLSSMKSVVSGTPGYIAPEVAQGHPGGPPSDIYALGVMLHEWLTGERPFDADNLMALLYAHVHSPIPDLPQQPSATPIPLALDELRRSMLAKDPADRPDALTLQTALGQVLNSLPQAERATGHALPLTSGPTASGSVTPLPAPPAPTPAPALPPAPDAVAPQQARRRWWLVAAPLAIGAVMAASQLHDQGSDAAAPNGVVSPTSSALSSGASSAPTAASGSGSPSASASVSASGSASISGTASTKPSASPSAAMSASGMASRSAAAASTRATTAAATKSSAIASTAQPVAAAAAPAAIPTTLTSTLREPDAFPDATQSLTTITLHWTTDQAATGYQISWKSIRGNNVGDSGSGTMQPTSGASRQQYAMRNLKPGNMYSYTVMAFNDQGRGPALQHNHWTLGALPTGTPAAVTGMNIAPNGAGSVILHLPYIADVAEFRMSLRDLTKGSEVSLHDWATTVYGYDTEISNDISTNGGLISGHRYQLNLAPIAEGYGLGPTTSTEFVLP